ncbi:arylesterase [Crucibulum laeve]|uniref:Arylesterase n=1 Tax=Crucibulum laeve TaxID=68775 RepID=A0A5C3M8Z6_9AGAR|nr:arylesterase [Crucibulum laeve]
MPSTRVLAYTALVLSVIAYRSGTVFKTSIIDKSAFPTGYVHGGDYSTDCKTLQDSDGSNDLKFCEDATFWELHNVAGKLEERRLLITCDPNRKSWNTVMGPLRDPAPLGALWLYTPHVPVASAIETPIKKAANLLKNIRGKKEAERAAEGKVQRLTLKDYPEGHDFHPLGVEVYPSFSGNASNVYVVNHARHRTTIEQFLLSPSEPTTVKYIRTLTSPYFIAPNALALTSPDSFYVTNDHLITRRLPVVGKILPLLESVFAIPFGFVSHVTLAPPSSPEAEATPILEHTFSKFFTPFANGIAISPSGTKVAIVSTSLGQVHLYNRDLKTNALSTVTDTIQVPFCPDNIRYSGEEIILAGHPHFPSLVQLAANKTEALSPSWVVKIRPPTDEEKEAGLEKFDLLAPISVSSKIARGNKWTVETLFQSDGAPEGFETSSTGLQDPKTGDIYVTGLYAEHGVLVCKPGKTTV